MNCTANLPTRFLAVLMMGSALAACGVQGVEETERAGSESQPAAQTQSATPAPQQNKVVYRKMETASAGGETHEHGAADMAITLQGKTLTVSLDAPLANFGLSEGGETVDLNGMGFSEGMVDLDEAARCVPKGSSVSARNSGDHGSLALEMIWTCARVNKLTAVKLNAFERYPGGFETVSVIFLADRRQIGGKLTAEKPTMKLQ